MRRWNGEISPVLLRSGSGFENKTVLIFTGTHMCCIRCTLCTKSSPTMSHKKRQMLREREVKRSMALSRKDLLQTTRLSQPLRCLSSWEVQTLVLVVRDGQVGIIHVVAPPTVSYAADTGRV